MVVYEAVYLIREKMDTRQMFGLPIPKEYPHLPQYEPAYRIRKDKIEAENEEDALKQAREIKHSIKDGFTEARIVSVSTEIKKKFSREQLEDLIRKFDIK